MAMCIREQCASRRHNPWASREHPAAGDHSVIREHSAARDYSAVREHSAAGESAEARSGRAVPGWAVIGAALSPLLLTGGYLIADVFQPPSYTPIRETVSAMAGQAGTDRWIMTGALFLVGACHLVTAAGLTRVRAPARFLLVVAGLSSIGIATSPEPVHGSTPRHLAWVALGAVIIAVWPAFTARRGPRRPLILGVYGSAAATAVFVALLGWLVIETRDGSLLGLAERLTSSVQTTWPFIVAVALRRSPDPAAGPARTGAAPAPRGPVRSRSATSVGTTDD
jgi:hypothetical membrane protein